MNTKVCSKCGKTELLVNYYKDKRSKDGLYSKCKKCHLEATRKHSKANYWKNPEGKVAYNKAYYEATKSDRLEDNRKRARDWYHKNRGRAITKIREREMKQKLATPKWLSEEHKRQINDIYEHAKDCSMVSGDVYEVDHIVPLNGENISGLHVPWNLQVLPMDINRAKSNKYDPDIQCPTTQGTS